MEIMIYILKSAAVLALFYGVYIAVLKEDTFFSANRHYLIAGIIAAIVLPFLQFTKTTYITIENTLSNQSFSETTEPIETVMPVQEVITFNWWKIALILYTVGVIIMLFRFLNQLFQLLSTLKKYPSEKIEGYKYVKVKEKTPPFSFFKTIVYNPSLHTPEELKMILKHEQVHTSQWHSIDIILANLLVIIQWINPLAWFYKKRIEENLEFIADSKTAQEVVSKKAYQIALVKASSTSIISTLTNNFYQSFIKKRIVMLNKRNSKKQNVWKLSIILPLLALFLWSFNVKEVQEYRETNPASLTMEPIFILHANSTDEEINAIEEYFKNSHPETLLKIKNRERNTNGEITGFSFETKFSENERFFKRFNRNSKEPFTTTYYIQYEKDATLLVTEQGEKGVKMKITSENIQFLDPEIEFTTSNIKEKESILGKNPLYIINTKEYKKDDLPNDKQIEVDGSIKVYNKSEGSQKYGEKGKDGVLEFQGTSTFVSHKNETPIKKAENNKDITIVITKNTTKEELDNIKKQMKELGFTFDYSNLNYNSSNEIISISIRYKDANNNSGNYSVNSDKPINSITIKSSGYKISVRSGGSGDYSYTNDEADIRRMELDKNRKELTERRKEMRNEMNDARKEIREEVNVNRSETRNDIRDEMKQKMKEQMREQREIMKEQRDLMREQKDSLRIYKRTMIDSMKVNN